MKRSQSFITRISGYKVALKLTRDPDAQKMGAVVTIFGPQGQIAWTGEVEVDTAGIKRQVYNEIQGEVGFSWGDITKAATRVVKKVGVKKIFRQLKEVIKDPRFEKSVAMASAIYPPLGISYGAIKQGALILDQARKGDIEAQMKIADIRAMAESGNVEAAKQARAMLAMYRAAKAGAMKEPSISGWAYNLPYRSPIMAMNFDRTPGNAIRHFYYRGVNER